ncbi:MAG: elongation factor 4 [Actinobacteria bacterium]|nr:MAG: elongation factor 4 [Actinomycetota bacterium]
MTDPGLIRNFSIIAHIDHGKSTLADRLLERTHALNERQMQDQVLDTMDLERERGITIKAQAVRISYVASDGQTYQLNLIDTPGHVDFSYEVSRSLSACEGVLLVVDASQGVEAQTVANAFLAQESDLVVIPVINKIDLPAADVGRTKREIEEGLLVDASDAIEVSAKTGQGVEEVLEALVTRVPPPSGDTSVAPRALIFDSFYDSYRGVVVFTRIVDGKVRKGQKIRAMATGHVDQIEELGVMRPSFEPTEELSAGEVGYVITGVKDARLMKVGDTLTDARKPAAEPLPGYREVKPMVYSGIYPIDGGEYDALREALEKLRLNDAALVFEPESSHALGFGFRCGFLGLLHMEIVKERLEREYDLELLATAPSVAYHVKKLDGSEMTVRSPAELPAPAETASIEEPYMSSVILVPPDYIGAVMELAKERRGEFRNMQYLSESTVELQYDLPLGEILLDFFDQLKSRTRGYASLDYEPSGYRPSQLVKLDILLAGEPVDALSLIIHKDKAYERGRDLTERLRAIIPRQMFEVPIQAAIGGRIVARETVKAKRKDVLAKCYGGDVTRKRKLLEKQKAGKKRMKQVGRLEVPQEAFMAVLKVDGEKQR